MDKVFKDVVDLAEGVAAHDRLFAIGDRNERDGAGA